jgi:CheY-like chemotaxis protein
MDGLTATKAIRSLKHDDASAIPIIAMTANVFEEDVNASRDAGMNAHLAKPIDEKKLRETILSLVAERTAL